MHAMSDVESYAVSDAVHCTPILPALSASVAPSAVAKSVSNALNTLKFWQSNAEGIIA